MDCATGELQCDACQAPGTVVRVDMLGTFLFVCSTAYYLCPCCTHLRVWTGCGSDLTAWAPGCAEQRAAERASAYSPEGWCRCRGGTRREGAHPQPPRCAVCGAKNTGRANTLLPDVHRGVMVQCYLCVRHSLPAHVQCRVTNTLELEAALGSAASGEAGRSRAWRA